MIARDLRSRSPCPGRVSHEPTFHCASYARSGTSAGTGVGCFGCFKRISPNCLTWWTKKNSTPQRMIRRPETIISNSPTERTVPLRRCCVVVNSCCCTVNRVSWPLKLWSCRSKSLLRREVAPMKPSSCRCRFFWPSCRLRRSRWRFGTGLLTSLPAFTETAVASGWAPFFREATPFAWIISLPAWELIASATARRMPTKEARRTLAGREHCVCGIFISLRQRLLTCERSESSVVTMEKARRRFDDAQAVRCHV